MRRRTPFLALALAAAAGAANAATLVVVNQSDGTVSFVDPATLRVRAKVSEDLKGESHAHEAAVLKDGKTVVLPVYGDSGVGRPGVDGQDVLFVDLSTRSVAGVLNLGHGVRPHQAVVDPASGLVYVTTELDRSVAIIDPAARTVVGSVPTGADQSHMLTLSRDGRLGYTANVGPGSVSVLDLKARKTLAVIPVAARVQRIALSIDDRLLFTADNQRPRLAVIDTATRTIRKWVKLPGLGFGAAATADGRWLLIAIPARNLVAVIDLKTFAVVRKIPVGAAPQETLIPPGGRVAYVSCAGEGGVTAIDLTTFKVIGTVATGPGADGLAWAEPGV